MIVDCDRATLQAALADEGEYFALLARGIYGWLAYPDDRARRAAFQSKLRRLVVAHDRHNAVGRRDRARRACNVGLRRVDVAVLVGAMAASRALDRDNGRGGTLMRDVAGWLLEPLADAEAGAKNAHARLWQRYLPTAHLACALGQELAAVEAAPEDAPDDSHLFLLLQSEWVLGALHRAEELWRPVIEEALDVELLPLLPRREETFPFWAR